MIPVRHVHDTVAWEVIYWAALVTLAGLITVLLAIKTAAG